MCISRGMGCRSENGTERVILKSAFPLVTQILPSLVVSLQLLGSKDSNLTAHGLGRWPSVPQTPLHRSATEPADSLTTLANITLP